MALIKKDYGLIYNDDGSLCVTVRDDDVPFQGVKSYAIEEATENLITDLDPRNWNNYGATVELTNEKYMNMPVYKVTMSETSGARIFFNIPYVTGDTLNGSVYIKPIQYSSVRNPDLFFREVGFGTVYEQIRFPSNMNVWNRINVNHTFDSDGTVMFLLYTPIATNDIPNIFYMAMPQVEKKPFATSFVDGSRPKGQIEISRNSLSFDIANDDWVISYWEKPIATRDGTLTSYNINALGRNVSGFTEGYIWWGKDSNYNYFRMAIVNINNENISINSAVFDPTWYFDNWHFEILLKVGNLLKYYVDGILQMSFTLSIPLLNNFDRGLFIGGALNSPSNSLISNLLYGKCRNKEGNLVWTDEYIQEVYEAKKPFNKNL
jgi:hypothetical protein